MKGVWGIAYEVNGNKIWMSTPFENPGQATYKFSSKKLAETYFDQMKQRQEYLPSGARVEKMA